MKTKKTKPVLATAIESSVKYSIDDMVNFERLIFALASLRGCEKCKIKYPKDKGDMAKIVEEGYPIKRCKFHKESK